MARKEKIIEIQDRGRKLVFKITEMPASVLEKWLLKAAIGLSGVNNNTEISGKPDLGTLKEADLKQSAEDDIQNISYYQAAVTTGLLSGGLGFLRMMDFDTVTELYEGLLDCCCIQVEPGFFVMLHKDTVDAQIEDVRTLFKLRAEALELNLGFLDNAAG